MSTFGSSRTPRIAKLWLLLPVLAGCAVYWPALRGSFSGDDWIILTLARHGGSPLAYYVQDHTLAYSYRPHGMLSWWLTARFFGAAPVAHYFAALGLHAFNGTLLALLARRWGSSWLIAAATGVLFVLHPTAIGTALWLSDRYDLLALSGSLCVLLSITRAMAGMRWSLPVLVLSGVVAAGSKETAMAAAVAGLAWIGHERFVRTVSAEVSWRMLIALLAPFVLALLLRFVVFDGSGLAQLGAARGAPLDHLAGVVNWLAYLPRALLGWHPAPGAAVMVCLLALAGLLLLLAWQTRVHAQEFASSGSPSSPGSSLRGRVLAAAALVLAPAVLQAPITRLVLSAPQPTASMTNARFYYLALAGAMLLLGLVLSRIARRGSAALHWQRLVAGGLVAAVAFGWGLRSHAMAAQWQRFTAEPSRMTITGAAVAAVRQAWADGSPCRVVLEGAEALHPDMRRFADSLVKAQLNTGEPATNCVVWGDSASWVALVARPLRAGQIPPARDDTDPLLQPRAILDLHAYFPAEACEVEEIRRFRWSGSAFVETTPSPDDEACR